MEHTSVNCVSVIFNTDFDFNENNYLKLESCIMLDNKYDEFLYKECARVEKKSQLYLPWAILVRFVRFKLDLCLNFFNVLKSISHRISRMNDIAVKEDGPSVPPAGSNNTSASTSNNGKEGDDNVNYSTYHVLVLKGIF